MPTATTKKLLPTIDHDHLNAIAGVALPVGCVRRQNQRNVIRNPEIEIISDWWNRSGKNAGIRLRSFDDDPLELCRRGLDLSLSTRVGLRTAHDVDVRSIALNATTYRR